MSEKAVPYKPQLTEQCSGYWSMIKQTASQWMSDNAMRLSASLALYTVLSLAPLLVISMEIVSVVYAHSSDESKSMIFDQLSSLMGSQVGAAVHETLQKASLHGNGKVATVISFVILFFSATGVFIELQDAMNVIWGVKPKPNMGLWNFVRNRLLSMAMVLGTGFILLVSMMISTFLTAGAHKLIGNSTWITYVLDAILSLCVISLLFAAIFKFLPDVKLSWRHVWVGAILTAVLFTVGKWAMAIYFDKAVPQSAYGAVGAPIVILIWVYYSAFILYFGAEFTKVWSMCHAGKVEPMDIAVPVTEEDRAQLGIPSEKRMKSALEGKPFDQLPPPTVLPRSQSQDDGRSRYLLAGGGLIVGAIAGGLGAHLMGRHKPLLTDEELDAVKFTERMKKVESKLLQNGSKRLKVTRAPAPADCEFRRS